MSYMKSMKLEKVQTLMYFMSLLSKNEIKPGGRASEPARTTRK
jgi:hypothetical protein